VRIIGDVRTLFAKPIRFIDIRHFNKFIAKSLLGRDRTILTFVAIDPDGRLLGERYRIKPRMLATAVIEAVERTTSAAPTPINMDQSVA